MSAPAAGSGVAIESGARFLAAHPVWPAGREREKNLLVAFRAEVAVAPGERVTLRATAACVYRAFLNGAFVGYGPARAARDWFRVDEWDLTPHLVAGDNVVAVEVAGYNLHSYYLMDQVSFFQAEVATERGAVLAATGGEPAFAAAILASRVQKVERYSFQRPFSEVYRLEAQGDDWRCDVAAPFAAVECVDQPDRNLLPRRVPYPRFERRRPVTTVARGTLRERAGEYKVRRTRALDVTGAKIDGFPEAELETIPTLELQRYEAASREDLDAPYDPAAPLALGAREWAILDLGDNLAGFPGVDVVCGEPTRFFLSFDELLRDGEVDHLRLNCANVIAWDLAPGAYRLEAFEPTTMRFLKLTVLAGACEARDAALREYVNSDGREAHFACSEPRINRVFEAGRETFRQNVLDVFMDCPSRERAGWLCDSFFTARATFALCGNTRVERAFFENYLRAAPLATLPDGMLPMCYPADHPEGMYIPNWALWFVVQLEEYLARSGDRALVDALRPKVMRLFDYFKTKCNEDGLLEKLEKWIFVEWSAANRFVQDVNYPSNMLYAAALAAAGRMYGDEALAARAAAVRDTVRARSFDGTFFVDNAVRRDGRLERTTNRTEACQYYAFFFDVATPRSHPDLWRTLCEEFGPHRKETGAHPDIHPANAFIGNMLRLELLSRYGRAAQVLAESVDYWLYMAERTGTLWEHVDTSASCDHGFTSHITHALYRDVLGLRSIDPVNRRVTLAFADLPLDWCEGVVPTPDGPISLAWQRRDGKLEHRLRLPAGWKAQQISLDAD